MCWRRLHNVLEIKCIKSGTFSFISCFYSKWRQTIATCGRNTHNCKKTCKKKADATVKTTKHLGNLEVTNGFRRGLHSFFGTSCFNTLCFIIFLRSRIGLDLSFRHCMSIIHNIVIIYTNIRLYSYSVQLRKGGH